MKKEWSTAEIRAYADNLEMLQTNGATFERVARDLFEKEINKVLVERTRLVVADLFNSQSGGRFSHGVVTLELSPEVIALAMANHIEGALISVAEDGQADGNILQFYGAMMQGKALSQMGSEVLNEMLSAVVNENLDSIKSGEIFAPVKH